MCPWRVERLFVEDLEHEGGLEREVVVLDMEAVLGEIHMAGAEHTVVVG